MVYLPSVEGAEGQLLEALELKQPCRNQRLACRGPVTQADISAIVFLQFSRIVLPHLFGDRAFPALDVLRERAYAAYPAFAETDPQPS